MFLQTVLRSNPALIKAAFELHQSGSIPPNCYVLDLDSMGQNTHNLVDAAFNKGIGLYFMSKQIGHNPKGVATIINNGIKRTVAVDVGSAFNLHHQGVQIGNIGHLSQVPNAKISTVIDLNPEMVTIFSLEKACAFSKLIKKGHFIQILLKIRGNEDLIYPGQQGGFSLQDLPSVIEEIAKLPGLKIAGATSFPCVQYDFAMHEYRPTPNLSTLLSSIEVIKEYSEGQPLQINAPGATCIETLPILHEAGVNLGEPGHAITGTNPHIADYEGIETPAIVYVSEISHCIGDTAYAFGGGIYPRGNLQHALVASRDKDLFSGPVWKAERPPSDHIDYYFSLTTPTKSSVHVGDTVICAFRPQIFVSYTLVAAVTGIQQGKPMLEGLFTSQGMPYTDWRH